MHKLKDYLGNLKRRHFVAFVGLLGVVVLLVGGGGAYAILKISGGSAGPVAQPGLIRQYWTGVTGNTVSNLTSISSYPNNPTGSDIISQFETDDWNNPSNNCTWADNYGERVTGYIKAPETGTYYFWVSSDDNSQLSISTDSNPVNASIVASMPGYSSCRQWTKYTQQASSGINMVKNQYYYVEGIHKEGGGGDSFSVGWRTPSDGPGSSPTEVVPNSVLWTGLPASTTTVKLGQAESGLVGWWKMDGNATDSTPYSDNGTVVGSPTATTDRKGIAGGSMAFNGSNDAYNLGSPSQLQITGSQTISMWLKPTSFSRRQNPYAKAYGGEGTITQETSGALSYYYGTSGANGGSYEAFGSTGVLTLNQWNHIVIVRDLSAMKLTWYINGVQTAQAAAKYAAAATSSLPVLIGDGYTSNYIGSIDDVRIYNRAISTTEVSNLYNDYNAQIELGGSGATGSVSLGKGLVGEWKFNGNANDFTPYGDNGTINGATLANDRFGRANSAYNFDGSSNYIQPSNVALSSVSAFTVSAWVKGSNSSSDNGGYSYIVHRGTNSSIGNSVYWLGVNNSGYFAASVNGSSVNSYGSTGVAANNDGWHLLTLSYDGSIENAYLDGVLKQTANVGAIANATSNTDLTIGGTAWSASYRPFKGQIDDVRIYSRALNSAEVQALYDLAG